MKKLIIILDNNDKNKNDNNKINKEQHLLSDEIFSEFTFVLI